MLSVIRRGFEGMKFPRLSPILLLYNPDIVIHHTPKKHYLAFGRSSVSPLTSASRGLTYRKSKSPISDDGTCSVYHQNSFLYQSGRSLKYPKHRRSLSLEKGKNKSLCSLKVIDLGRNEIKPNSPILKKNISGNDLNIGVNCKAHDNPIGSMLELKTYSKHESEADIAQKRKLWAKPKDSVVYYSLESQGEEIPQIQDSKSKFTIFDSDDMV